MTIAWAAANERDTRTAKEEETTVSGGGTRLLRLQLLLPTTIAVCLITAVVQQLFCLRIIGLRDVDCRPVALQRFSTTATSDVT